MGGWGWGAGGTCQKCGQCDYRLSLKRRLKGTLRWLDVEREEEVGGTPLHTQHPAPPPHRLVL